MPEAPGTAVYENGHLAHLLYAHDAGGLRIEYLVHHLHFQEVVAGAQRAQLGRSSPLWPDANLIRVSAIQTAAGLAHLQVLRNSVTPLDGPARSLGKHAIDLSTLKAYLAGRPQP